MKENPNRSCFKSGNENPNFSRFAGNPSYEGKTVGWWRQKLKKDIAKCECCGFLDKRILIVHHIDRDTTNNTKDNLELLCPNCHALEHYLSRDGTWWNMKND